MSVTQIFRGNPNEKLLHLIDDFSGGINVVDVDGVIKDNEFRKLVNVELAQKGLVQNRKGFKYVNMFDELLTDLSLNLPNPTHLFKVIRDDGNLLEKLVEFSFIDVQEPQEQTDWTYNPTSQTLTYSNFLTSISGQDHDLLILMANQYGVYSLSIYTDRYGMLFGDMQTLKLFDKQNVDYTEIESLSDFIFNWTNLFPKYDYLKLTIDYGGTSDFFVTIDQSLSVLDGNICDVPDIEVKRIEIDGSDLYFSIINNTSATIKFYLSFVNVKPTKTNIKTVDYGDKVYFSTSDIINSEDAIAVYDVLTNSVSYIDKDNYYKPNAYDIMNFAKDLGFNMLASSPATAIDVLDTTLKTIQTVWITNSSGQLLEKIPKNGQFVLNVLTTGTILSPYELKIIFKNHLGTVLAYSSYGIDVDGGIIKYIFDGAAITGFSDALSLEIEIEKKEKAIEVVNLSKVFPKFYPESVVDNSVIYITNDNNYYLRISNSYGFVFSSTSYSSLAIENSVESADPMTDDPTIVFSMFMTVEYSGRYFELFNNINNVRVLYRYNNLSSSFEKVYDSRVVGFTFLNKENVCPLKYSIFKDTATSLYYVVSAITTSSITYSELENYDENEIILPLLGQTIEIGASIPQSLNGVSLADVNIIEIDGRMLYYNENTIWFSADLGRFDYLPNNNYVILPITINDKIISINFFRNSYIIFTKYKIFKMSKNFGDVDFSIDLVSDFIGAISANSIRAIDNSLYFLSEKGLYRLVLNYYVDGYENVQKVDDKLGNEIVIVRDVYSLLYNGQYWSIYNNDDITPSNVIDTIKYYYNIELSNKRHPFVFDIYAKKPDLLIPNNLFLLAIKDNRLYIFDDGYTDFYYNDSLDVNDYIPMGEIELSNLHLGTPTHDKKFKSIYFKTYCDRIVPLYITAKIDGYVIIDPNSYTVSVNDIGEILYTVIDDSNLEIKKDLLGNFIIGNDKLGDNNQAVHKLIVARKGKAIQLKVKFKTQNYFGIANIGVLYKLGKIKENR